MVRHASLMPLCPHKDKNWYEHRHCLQRCLSVDIILYDLRPGLAPFIRMSQYIYLLVWQNTHCDWDSQMDPLFVLSVREQTTDVYLELFQLLKIWQFQGKFFKSFHIWRNLFPSLISWCGGGHYILLCPTNKLIYAVLSQNQCSYFHIFLV